MTNVIDEFFYCVTKAREEKDGHLLANLLVFAQHDEATLRLRDELALFEDLNLSGECNKRFVSWKGFSLLISSYLEFLRDVDFGDIRQAFDLIVKIVNQMASAFSHVEAAWLIPAVKKLSAIGVNLAFLCDKSSNDPKSESVNSMSRVVFRIFNNVLSDRQSLSLSKKGAVFHIANLLFRMYFALGQVRLCQTLHSNIASADVEFSSFSRADRVTYRYYLGRHYLFQNQFHRSRKHLYYAFNNCLSQTRNKRLIFIYLATCSIILGIFPSLESLRDFDVTPIFLPIMQSIKFGDHSRLETHLNAKETFNWFIRHGVYLTFKNRSQLLISRSLFRRTFLLTYNSTSKTTFVACSDLLKAYQWNNQNNTITLDDVECICVALIDQALVEGYIMHSRRYLVLKRATNHGFRPISSVLPDGSGHDYDDEDDKGSYPD